LLFVSFKIMVANFGWFGGNVFDQEEICGKSKNEQVG
jgi:hypothetical protein